MRKLIIRVGKFVPGISYVIRKIEKKDERILILENKLVMLERELDLLPKKSIADSNDDFDKVRKELEKLKMENYCLRIDNIRLIESRSIKMKRL